MMQVSSSRVFIADHVLLDGRLALFHEREKWLAIADLHFGYELSRRAAGWLIPFWGMDSITERLFELLKDYTPERLIILGDLVHDRAARFEARKLLEQVREFCEVIVISGNHDRQLHGTIELFDSWSSNEFHFHHGHCAVQESQLIQVIGHHHPAGSLSDGAGLHLKLPAFVQQKRCWIMPAFSPWAAGTTWLPGEESRIWLCSPQRILPVYSDR
jgi:DNA ligase-associated metallophosphoesterase